MNKTISACSFLLFSVASWAGLQNPEDTTTTIRSLKFIGEYTIENGKQFNQTTIGGLSGIDYDPVKSEYYLLSDDRSEFNPARFYVSKIYFTSTGIDSVQFLSVHKFLQPNGNPFPPRGQSHASIDPEAMRYNRATNKLVWASEGERIVNNEHRVVVSPSIMISEEDGQSAGTFPLPGNLKMQQTEIGPRKNGTFEGITFGEDFKTMIVSMEEPLYEDGARAALTETNSYVRFYEYNVDKKVNTAQYAYKLEPIAYPSIPDDSFKMNGVSEILFVGDKKLLVIERSYSTGHFGCTIKLFIADLETASDIKNIQSLKRNPPERAIKKKLLLNMNNLEIYIDNIEGVTFGPDFPNGHKSLIFISDDNFNKEQKTQFLLFEVLP